MSSMVGAGAGHAGSTEGDLMMPPLSVLLKRELTSEQIDRPDILHGLASRSKKGEDLTFLKTECQRVPGNGATTFSVFAIGPLRCWPGGLCLSRSIGDVDVGEFIVPIPHVKQVKLSNAGGRLIISSDGVWDALSFESALNCSRGHPADIAANKIVKEAVQVKGLRDDTTCIVVDLLPPENKSSFVSQPKKKVMRVLKNMFQKKSYETPSNLLVRNYFEPYAVEELFEDGSAVLAQRLNMVYPISNLFKLLICAVCQVEMKPGEGTSVNAGSLKSGNVCLWEGPLLCRSCQFKNETMEGKRPSRNLCRKPDGNEYI